MSEVKIFTFTESELDAVIVRAVQLALNSMNGSAGHNGNGQGERWLTPQEAADQLRVSVDWLYRHARKWHFVRRPTRKLLLISETGLNRWAASKKPLP